MNRYEFNHRWSELHGNVEVAGVIKGWLFFSYYIARVLSFLRITPNVLTTLGIVFSLWMIKVGYYHEMIILLILALICDGVDGSVAIYRNRATPMGALYDSVADRITEAIWLSMCIYVDISVRFLITIWVLGAVQEYMRTKLSTLGYSEIGVVTPTERPMRAIFVLLAMITYIFGFAVTEEMAWIFIGLQLFSVWKIAKMSHSVLAP